MGALENGSLRTDGVSRASYWLKSHFRTFNHLIHINRCFFFVFNDWSSTLIFHFFVIHFSIFILYHLYLPFFCPLYKFVFMFLTLAHTLRLHFNYISTFIQRFSASLRCTAVTIKLDIKLIARFSSGKWRGVKDKQSIMPNWTDSSCSKGENNKVETKTRTDLKRKRWRKKL